MRAPSRDAVRDGVRGRGRGGRVPTRPWRAAPRHALDRGRKRRRASPRRPGPRWRARRRCTPKAPRADAAKSQSSFPTDDGGAVRFHHPSGPLQPRAISALRTASRPRWMRDFTVPISTDVITAISSYGKPSTSRSRSAVRCSAGNEPRAASTSARASRSPASWLRSGPGAAGSAHVTSSSSGGSSGSSGLRFRDRSWSSARLVAMRKSHARNERPWNEAMDRHAEKSASWTTSSASAVVPTMRSAWR